MPLWKRIRFGASAVLLSVCVAGFGAMLPAGIIPPVSTVLALFVIPVVVVGGSRVLSIRHRFLAEAAADARSLPERMPMGAARSR